MNESEFDKVGRDELSHLEERFDSVDPDDVDCSSSDGVLTLELRDGARVVVNTHRAARQIWMAAVDTAWHFDFVESEGVWRTQDGQELRPTLAKLVRDHTGVAVDFDS